MSGDERDGEVEHDMDVVMGISDWVVCLAQGAVISEGLPQAVGSDPRVIDAYLGAHHDTDLSDDALLADVPGSEALLGESAAHADRTKEDPK